MVMQSAVACPAAATTAATAIKHQPAGRPTILEPCVTEAPRAECWQCGTLFLHVPDTQRNPQKKHMEFQLGRQRCRQRCRYIPMHARNSLGRSCAQPRDPNDTHSHSPCWSPHPSSRTAIGRVTSQEPSRATCLTQKAIYSPSQSVSQARHARCAAARHSLANGAVVPGARRARSRAQQQARAGRAHHRSGCRIWSAALRVPEPTVGCSSD